MSKSSAPSTSARKVDAIFRGNCQRIGARAFPTSAALPTFFVLGTEGSGDTVPRERIHAAPLPFGFAGRRFRKHKMRDGALKERRSDPCRLHIEADPIVLQISHATHTNSLPRQLNLFTQPISRFHRDDSPTLDSLKTELKPRVVGCAGTKLRWGVPRLILQRI